MDIRKSLNILKEVFGRSADDERNMANNVRNLVAKQYGEVGGYRSSVTDISDTPNGHEFLINVGGQGEYAEQYKVIVQCVSHDYKTKG